MQAYVQNMLANIANKRRFAFAPLAVAVSGILHPLASAPKAYATVSELKAKGFKMLRRIATRSTVVGGLWAGLAVADVASRAPRDVARAVERLPLTIEEQWARVTAIVRAALEGVRHVVDLHRAAARQIDAADYALSQLMQDLRTAMPLPADVAALRAILAEAERTAPVRQRPAAMAA